MTESEFETKQAKELKVIPEEFHAAIKNLAWQEGHAYGYEEVLNLLNDIVYGLKEPIKTYTDRIIEETNNWRN